MATNPTTGFISYNSETGILTAGDVQFRMTPLTADNADILQLAGAGAPVDYTDGTPPATGEGVAGIGSVYTNITNGKKYLNGGTKAQPIWKLVTSAA